jgi:hypothetical protein
MARRSISTHNLCPEIVLCWHRRVGSLNDFKAIVQELHEIGIKVRLDKAPASTPHHTSIHTTPASTPHPTPNLETQHIEPLQTLET